MEHGAYVVIILMFAIFSIAAFCFYTGMLYERAKWNELIEDGLIPPPKAKKGIQHV